MIVFLILSFSAIINSQPVNIYINNSYNGQVHDGSPYFPYTSLESFLVDNLTNLGRNSSINIIVNIAFTNRPYYVNILNPQTVTLNNATLKFQPINSNQNVVTLTNTTACSAFPMIIIELQSSSSFIFKYPRILEFYNMNFHVYDTNNSLSAFTIKFGQSLIINNSCIQTYTKNYTLFYVTSPLKAFWFSFTLKNSLLVKNQKLNHETESPLFSLLTPSEPGYSNITIINTMFNCSVVNLMSAYNNLNFQMGNITSNCLTTLEIYSYWATSTNNNQNLLVQYPNLQNFFEMSLANLNYQINILTNKFKNQPYMIGLNTVSSIYLQNIVIQLYLRNTCLPNFLAINVVNTSQNLNPVININNFNLNNSYLMNSSTCSKHNNPMNFIEINPNNAPVILNNMNLINVEIYSTSSNIMYFYGNAMSSFLITNISILNSQIMNYTSFQVIDFEDNTNNQNFYYSINLQNIIISNNTIINPSNLTNISSSINIFNMPSEYNANITNISLSNENVSGITYFSGLNTAQNGLFRIVNYTIINCNFETSSFIDINLMDIYLNYGVIMNSTFIQSELLILINDDQILVAAYITNTFISNSNFVCCWGYINFEFSIYEDPTNISLMYFSNNTIINCIFNDNTLFFNVQNIQYFLVNNNSWSNLELCDDSVLINQIMYENIPLHYDNNLNNPWINCLMNKFEVLNTSTIGISLIENIYAIPYINNSIGYVIQISNNTFLNLSLYDVSQLLLLVMEEDQEFEDNYYISIDNNQFYNINVINVLQSNQIMVLSGLSNVAFCKNILEQINGNNNFLKVIATYVNLLNYSENSFNSINNSNIITVLSYNSRLFQFTSNILNNINATSTLITLETTINSGYFIYTNNFFININIYADQLEYQGIYLINMLIYNVDNDNELSLINIINDDYNEQDEDNEEESINLGINNDTTILFSNNSLIQCNLKVNHTRIKQYINSLLYLNIPNDTILIINNNFSNINILQSNLLNIIAKTIMIQNSNFTNIYSENNYDILYMFSEQIYLYQNMLNQLNYVSFSNTLPGYIIYIDHESMLNSIMNVTLKNNLIINNLPWPQGSFFGYTGQALNLTSINNSFILNNSDNNISNLYGKYLFLLQNCEIMNIYFDQLDIKLININSFNLFHLSNVIILTKIYMNNVSIIVENSFNIVLFKYVNVAGYRQSSLALPETSQTNQIIQNFTLLPDSEESEEYLLINTSSVLLKFQNINLLGSGTEDVKFLICDQGNFELINISISELMPIQSILEFICSENSIFNTKVINITNLSVIDLVIPSNIVDDLGIIHISGDGSGEDCYNIFNFQQINMSNINATAIITTKKQFSAILDDFSTNNSLQLSIDSSYFFNIISNFGPCFLSLSPIANSMDNILITNSIFNSNYAYNNGGAIQISNRLINITNSQFINNQAYKGTGASIFSYNIQNSLNVDPNQNNTFVNNKRYMYYFELNDSANLNLSEFNGDFGSNPSNLAINSLIPVNDNTAIIYNNGSISNASSYSLVNLQWILYIEDPLGQIVYDDNRFVILSAILSGNRPYYSPICNFRFCYISNASIYLYGTDQSIIQLYIIYNSSQYIVPPLSFTAELRACILGEINTTALPGSSMYVCQKCPSSTYSLNIHDTQCTPCPITKASECPGGSEISLLPNFWRANTTTDNILPCRLDGMCGGGFDINCTSGFIGPLCQSCDGSAGYARAGENQCGKCHSNKYFNLMLTILVSLLVFCYQTWCSNCTYESNAQISRVNWNENSRKKFISGVYIRLLITYSQIFTIVSTFNSNLSSFIESFVGIPIRIAGNPLKNILYSISCNYINFGFDPNKMLYYNLTTQALLPIAYFFFVSMIFVLIWKIKKVEIDRYKLCYIANFFICTFTMYQPCTFGSLVSYLQCSTLSSSSSSSSSLSSSLPPPPLSPPPSSSSSSPPPPSPSSSSPPIGVPGNNNDNALYITTELNYQCNTPEYNSYLYNFVVPNLLGWGVVIPLILFLILYYYQKNNIHGEMQQLCLGSLTNGFESRAYFWGIVIMGVKLILTLESALFYSDINESALIILVTLYLYYQLFKKIRPYSDSELYNVEKFTIFTYIATIFFVFYLKDNPVYLLKVIAVLVIIFMNGYTICTLVWNIFKIYLPTINQLILKITYKVKNLRQKGEKKIASDINVEIAVHHFTKPY